MRIPLRPTTFAAVLVLGAAACGADGEDTPATGGGTVTTAATTTTIDTEQGSDADLERIAEAAENTVDQGTATFTITVESAGTGVADGQAPAVVEGEVDFDEQRRRLVFTSDTGTLEVLVDGTELYLEVPATEDETWARLDLDELMDGDAGFGGPAGLPFQDPAGNLALLQRSATSVEVAGEEQVGGEDTTRYRVTLDVERAAAEADSGTGGALDRSIEQSGATELDMDVWIDDDDVIRQVAYTLDMSQADGTAVAPAGQVIVTVTYSDFGTDLEIEVPEDEQVVNLDEEQVRGAFEGMGTGATGGGAGGTTTTTTG